MRHLLTALALISLSGCVAAIPLYMAASYGLSAFAVYQVYSVGNVKDAEYSIEKHDPAPAALQEIKAASSLALFPTNTSIDGAVVDIFNERSGLNTISSRITIEEIERSNISHDRLLAYPAADRAEEIAKFGRSVGADMVLFATLAGTKVNTNGFIASGNNMVIEVNSKLYSAQTGEVLLDEMHRIKIDVGDTPTNLELNQISAMGIADRLYELRTGIARQQAVSSPLRDRVTLSP